MNRHPTKLSVLVVNRHPARARCLIGSLGEREDVEVIGPIAQAHDPHLVAANASYTPSPWSRIQLVVS
jgi:hypothetical protein